MKIKDKELTLTDKTIPIFASIINKRYKDRHQVECSSIVLIEYVLYDTPIHYTLYSMRFFAGILKINNATNVLGTYTIIFFVKNQKRAVIKSCLSIKLL